MNKVECWGMRSGIVKIIPPVNGQSARLIITTTALPSTVPQLAHVRLRNPIEQQMLGRGGYLGSRTWRSADHELRDGGIMCQRYLRAPTIEEAQGGRRHTAGTMRLKTRRGRAVNEQSNESKEHNVQIDQEPDDLKVEEEISEDNVHNHGDTVVEESKVDPDCGDDPASTLPTPPPTTNPSDTPPVNIATSPKPGPTKRSAAERKEAKDALDVAFLATFDPHKDWLPQGMVAEDYTPEFCRVLERIYWRNCSLGRAAWYGADMQGSLFTDDTQHWNVAHLPSVLSRLLGKDSMISGVNTPYLYFGMWRATFAWHVEDMDLFSINYIHFGSPKHWYAVPQARSQALETTMKGYFPQDNTTCPQFLRHKSFLASPTLLGQSSVRPNVLVQHAGEFVVTFPRGYHAGFNLGFNCAESVNFALDSWIELGLRASYCACEADSVRIDVEGLILAKERREREGEGSPASENVTPSRKRKVEVFLPNAAEGGSKPKRSKMHKMLPASPDSIPPLSQPKPAKVSKPKPKAVDADAGRTFPCCLCASSSTDDLLRVHDPPIPFSGLMKPADGVWRAHEACARVVPETWVDDMLLDDGSGGMEKVVWGVDGIVKDRWLLKCAACTGPRCKTHGAPVQCTKGKCSKAFHVSCAANSHTSGNGVAYRVLEDIEKQVVLLEPETDPASQLPLTSMAIDGPQNNQSQMSAGTPSAMKSPPTLTAALPTPIVQAPVLPESVAQLPTLSSPSLPVVSTSTPKEEGPRVLKTIKKLLVEVLCPQHNPVVIAQKKADKDQKVRRDLEALPEMSRIRIRNASGVFEVSLVKVIAERGTVEVLWDGGQKREFKWGSIVWSSDGQTTGSKPTAEDLAKNPPSPTSKVPIAPTPARPAQHAKNSSTLPQQPMPPFSSYGQSGPMPYPCVSSPGEPRAELSRMPSYSGVGRNPGQTVQDTTTRASGQQQSQWTPPPRPVYPYVQSATQHSNGSARPPYQGYYSHPYYQQPGYAQSPPAPSTSSSPHPYATLNELPPHFASYYARTPYLPLAPRPGVSSSSLTGNVPPAANGASLTHSCNPLPVTGDGPALAKAASSAPQYSSLPAPVPTPGTASTPLSLAQHPQRTPAP
ncbi:JmjC domain, hydroxylase-domain-containing protein [Gautieria morchelliformis]|nr:JmjC domain, hydroxylase-domain-containing protein [Gautieria morchelliformis]